jgi:hypothetical protein
LIITIFYKFLINLNLNKEGTMKLSKNLLILGNIFSFISSSFAGGYYNPKSVQFSEIKAGILAVSVLDKGLCGTGLADPMTLNLGIVDNLRPGRIIKKNMKAVIKNCYSVRVPSNCIRYEGTGEQPTPGSNWADIAYSTAQKIYRQNRKFNEKYVRNYQQIQCDEDLTDGIGEHGFIGFFDLDKQ